MILFIATDKSLWQETEACQQDALAHHVAAKGCEKHLRLILIAQFRGSG